MSRLVIRCARVVPGDGSPVLPRATVVVSGDQIVSVSERDPEPNGDAEATLDTVIEAEGRVLMPGFVDAHTHALWAGDRLDEFELQQRGASYLEILAAGGGILSTVRAVRAASQAELTENLRRRLATLGIDAEALARSRPQLFAEMQARCRRCDSKGACRWDLAQDPARGAWRRYCQNAAELDALAA